MYNCVYMCVYSKKNVHKAFTLFFHHYQVKMQENPCGRQKC